MKLLVDHDCAVERWQTHAEFGQNARAVNIIQSHFAERSCSWDIFAYDLLPNQLRPTDLLLGQVSIFPLAPLRFA